MKNKSLENLYNWILFWTFYYISKMVKFRWVWRFISALSTAPEDSFNINISSIKINIQHLESGVMYCTKIPVHIRIIIQLTALVETECRFWKIIDVAYTFYKNLENASKFYMRCRMIAAWKFFKKFRCIFRMKDLCNLQFFQVCLITLNKLFFWNWRDTLLV